MSQPVTQETSEPRLPPVMRMVAELPGGPYFLISQTHKLTGVPVATLRRWMRNKVTKAPSKQVNFGGLTVYLYTQDDIREIKLKKHGQCVVEDRDRGEVR
jgi:hypothetical protein